ncbi:hypothetical protein [Yinghuangia seranimata]|uniref:hypothetical protein n=1 Tax=Yinghuangia seranimata TaxID=408067 RepID=UPI00248B3E7E|nr:hypothetical protein [Yinghuangia seranimata]MDI2130309.1 hypothetical protein [Yinghuangia seranimata]
MPKRALGIAVAAVVVMAGAAACSDDAKDYSDASEACTVLKQVPTRMPEPAKDGPAADAYETATSRYQAAVVLARAASLKDAKHKAMYDALQRGQDEFSRSFDIHKVEPAAAEALKHC